MSYEYNPETGAQTKQSTSSSSGTLTIERGYDRRGFFEIDTGNRLDFTQKLSD